MADFTELYKRLKQEQAQLHAEIEQIEAKLQPTSERREGSPFGKKEEEAEVLLSFSQLIEPIILGKKVHKAEWEDKEYYGFLDKGVLKLHKPDGSTHQWILSDVDLMGTDYMVL